MDDDGAERAPHVPATQTPVAPDRRARGPGVVDAEFRVLPPIWHVWRDLRDSWWALGPYLAYCTALWGLAALLAWLMDRGTPHS
jgi:hypothetical protein